VSRLRHLEEHRFIGTRDDMVLYDCDDELAFSVLQARADIEDLVGKRLVSTFGPDSLAEARNRGFRPR
jgi:hypothetical protein